MEIAVSGAVSNRRLKSRSLVPSHVAVSGATSNATSKATSNAQSDSSLRPSFYQYDYRKHWITVNQRLVLSLSKTVDIVIFYFIAS